MMKKVEFYYDIGSPYSYLASTRIEDICERYDAELEWMPILLGGALKESGNRAPIDTPNKRIYVPKDLQDWAKFYQITLNFPENFPLGGLKAMRGALIAKDDGIVEAYSHKLFNLYWIANEDLNQDEVLKKAVGELGMDSEKFIERIGQQKIKDRLRDETALAVKRGAFGVPTFFIEDRMFWGNDRLVFVEEYLKGNL